MATTTSLDISQYLRSRAEVLHQPAFIKAAAEVIVSSVNRNFQVGGRYGGNAEQEPFAGGPVKWRPVNAQYAKQKAKAGKSATNILLWTGRLRTSIGWQMQGGRMVLGTNLAYAAIHQFGGTVNVGAYSRDVKFKIVKGKLRFAKNSDNSKGTFVKNVSYPAHSFRMPARPFIVVQSDDIYDIMMLAVKYMNQ